MSNSSGQIVAKEKIQATEGFNTYQFTDNDNLKNGIYFITIIYNNQKITRKVVKS